MDQRKKINTVRWLHVNVAESTLKMQKQKNIDVRFLMKFKFFIIFLLFLTVFFIGLFYIRQAFMPVSSDGKPQAFMVNKGSSVSLIGKNLEKDGLVKSGIAFKFYVQITNLQNKIQAGEFELSKNLSLIQIVEKLKKGPVEIWVTIPEGLRREEIGMKFKTTLAKDDEFYKEFLEIAKGKEGYLFPETYLFSKDISATQIVNKMTKTFETKVKDITYKQLIVASMLERETLADNEKPIVAGILYKRIENDWPLQVDATLQYIKGDWKPVYSVDKELKSPFNTYKNLGLPPSPISNPGLSSILAAISPEESEYWYYIHDNDGKIHFAKDLNEHNANINKYLD
ncbi:MAG: hypothetical protein ACD_19C00429G0069 [uncultured bacterium]|nr:MAG: hypothetical protein ACD_19C00429G0069 [uncultured bacterium]